MIGGKGTAMMYEDVVMTAKEVINSRTNYRNRKVIYVPCPIWEAGNQINLWSYWQGFQLKDIGKERVDILLVGQDWGSPDKHPYECKRIEEIQAGKNLRYIAESATDKNLAKMFKVFGEHIDINSEDPGMRLFFTNYSLGYRSKDISESGGMTKTLMKMDDDLFRDLVEALNPKIIVCLGKLTYECVSNQRVKDFIRQLHDGKPFVSPYPYKEDIPVYGVSHTGARGISNIGGEEKMRRAWQKIADDYYSLYQNT